ncbi:MAG: hypothetical protein ACPG4Z_01295 [Chitinophagales bacterium]
MMTRFIAFSLLTFSFIFSFAQDKQEIDIQIENDGKTAEIKITENGKTSIETINIEEWQDYLDENEINVKIESDGKSTSIATTDNDENIQVNIEGDLESFLENIVNEDFDITSLEDLMEKVEKSIEYTETVDKDGNVIIDMEIKE